MTNKRQRGQYFTTTNPFMYEGFQKWFDSIPAKKKLLEPFAGANNIPKLMNDFFKEDNFSEDVEWGSFDIEPDKVSAFCGLETKQNDSLKSMPKGYDAIITNPPYLAKNSATRRGLKWHSDNTFDDLYKYSLQKMLESYEYVAAIIPDSFITSGEFRSQLHSVISLPIKMFDDTDCPVCLAMFASPLAQKEDGVFGEDFKVYRLNNYVGKYNDIANKYQNLLEPKVKIDVSFNDPAGNLGLYAVDTNTKASIRFTHGKNIAPETIKHTSRAITRIKVDTEINDNIIDQANQIIEDFRRNTSDIFLTSFKGVRKDGYFRRRLDFRLSKNIIANVLQAG